MKAPPQEGEFARNPAAGGTGVKAGAHEWARPCNPTTRIAAMVTPAGEAPPASSCLVIPNEGRNGNPGVTSRNNRCSFHCPQLRLPRSFHGGLDPAIRITPNHQTRQIVLVDRMKDAVPAQIAPQFKPKVTVVKLKP
jgi:hypothetical protein